MSTQQTSKLRPGEARSPGPSTREIILSDGWKVPDALVAERYEFQGDDDIPYERYTSQEFFDLEMEKLWPRVWQWACREEHIPEPGDYVVYDVGRHSIIVVRANDGSIKGFYNACLHRGTKLCASHSQGSVPQFRCSFHGWTWSVDGELEDIPCRWDFPHVEDEAYRLPEVRVETWGGFVFINMDQDAPPLQSQLDVLPEHFSNWPLEDRYVAFHVQKELPCNWKAAQEAFLEAYHVVETHAQALPTAGDANAQYDVFGEFVTRFVHTIGFPSPHWKEPITQQEILDRMRVSKDSGEQLVVPEGGTARSVAANYLRKKLGKELRVDLSAFSDSEMLDSIEYHLFPNMFLFPGVSLPMIYRFRPLGSSVDKSLFDLLFLRPIPPGEEAPMPPEPVRIGVDESYTSVPGMDQGLGFVYDQDTMNLKLQQEGFSSSKKRGETLGNYQEVRIRNIHRTLDRFLAG